MEIAVASRISREQNSFGCCTSEGEDAAESRTGILGPRKVRFIEGPERNKMNFAVRCQAAKLQEKAFVEFDM